MKYKEWKAIGIRSILKKSYKMPTKEDSWTASRLNTLQELWDRADTEEEKEMWDNTDLNYLTDYILTEIEKIKE